MKYRQRLHNRWSICLLCRMDCFSLPLTGQQQDSPAGARGRPGGVRKGINQPY